MNFPFGESDLNWLCESPRSSIDKISIVEAHFAPGSVNYGLVTFNVHAQVDCVKSKLKRVRILHEATLEVHLLKNLVSSAGWCMIVHVYFILILSFYVI